MTILASLNKLQAARLGEPKIIYENNKISLRIQGGLGERRINFRTACDHSLPQKMVHEYQ